MKSPDQIKKAIPDEMIMEAFYPLLEPLILKVYNMGYIDACVLHTLSKKITEQLNKNDSKN